MNKIYFKANYLFWTFVHKWLFFFFLKIWSENMLHLQSHIPLWSPSAIRLLQTKATYWNPHKNNQSKFKSLLRQYLTTQDSAYPMWMTFLFSYCLWSIYFWYCEHCTVYRIYSFVTDLTNVNQHQTGSKELLLLQIYHRHERKIKHYFPFKKHLFILHSHVITHCINRSP